MSSAGDDIGQYDIHAPDVRREAEGFSGRLREQDGLATAIGTADFISRRSTRT